MTVFKENLTSKILQIDVLKLISSSKKKLNILEMGCGNGNISKFLIENQTIIKHNYFLSDISSQAIKSAKKNINYDKSVFKVGPFYESWNNYKFDLIISDVSSIADDVAIHSDWYKGVTCDSGKDGLKNIELIINQTKEFLNKEGRLIFPIISLCNVKKLKKITSKNFIKIKYTKKKMWPLPKFFSNKIDIFLKLKKNNLIEYDEKFGIFIAYTHTAICQKTL